MARRDLLLTHDDSDGRQWSDRRCCKLDGSITDEIDSGGEGWMESKVGGLRHETDQSLVVTSDLTQRS